MTETWTNRGVASLLLHIADLLETKGENRFKVMAYRRASESILNLKPDITDVWQEGHLKGIPGVGDAIARKLDELFRTGHMTFLTELEAEVPPSLTTLLQVPGVGPKTARLAWEALGVKDLAGLERAARAGRLRKLPGLGERTESRILDGMGSLRRRTGRMSLGRALPLAETLLDSLRETVPGIARAEAVGSLRRMCATIGGIDLLVSAPNAQGVLDAFAALPQVAGVFVTRPAQISVRLDNGAEADLYVVPAAQWGTSLQYRTGSKGHNIRLQELAEGQGLSLTEHGFREGDALTPCATEEEVYRRLGLPWVPPELREDRGEIAAAQEGRLPHLVELSDLRGDLHAHSNWSDGRDTLETMAEAARALGLEYLLVSDHTHGLGVAGGLSPEKWQRQHQAIKGLNARWTDFRLFHGAEVEIRGDGTLDFPDEVLAQMDVVVASIHSGLRQPKERITERMLSAMRNPHVDIIGHPMGRILGQREESAIDVDALISSAAKTGTVLEINSIPERLDLADVYVRQAIELGVRLAVNSDAHSTVGLQNLPYGLATARRGWATKADIVNCLPPGDLWAFFQGRSWP